MNLTRNKLVYLTALITSVLVLPFSVACQSSVDASRFVERRFLSAGNESLRYLLFVPAHYDRGKKYPLVLWFHGGGARGDNPKTILSWGDKHGPLYLARPDNQSDHPCFVLAPQCPAGKLWADPMSDQPLDQLRLVLELLDSIEKEFSIDAKRLYVIGISMGGYATWDIIARRPNRFEAAVPICGGGNPAKAPRLVNTAIWAFHGEKDDLVKVEESRMMIAAIERAGGKPKYTEYRGVGHSAWEEAFNEPGFLEWMFSRVRE
jgi:predicted peptidase